MQGFMSKDDVHKSERMKNYFGIEGGGLVHDIFAAQKLSQGLESYTPFSDKQVTELKTSISTPFIAQMLLMYNDNLIKKIEETKAKNISTYNETPKTAADSVFEGILAKYKGKAVLIDFWATWCGPCRSSIQTITPLKEELANANVAFVYITDESSPMQTYKNMIPMIKGEHYRTNPDEWNVLSSRFNITAIPRYMLIDKDGRIVNDRYPYHNNNDKLKTDLLELANKK
jgi:thiol-disulfide isomerase/thioredoxin